MSLRLKELNQLWGKPFNTNATLNELVGPVCTDSRLASKGCFFVPLVGEFFDGHEFLTQAFLSGAHAAIVSTDTKVLIPDGLIFWKVEDTLKAFQQLALLHRNTLDVPVIAVTGSVGKSTTREFIRASLAKFGPVMSTEKNNNNDIGVPVTLLKASSCDTAVVLEMGMRGLGEIRRLSYCAKPNYAVITNIGNAHVGRLGSKKNIALAKSEITSYLNSSGTLFIPANDTLLDEVLSDCWHGKTVRVTVEKSLLDINKSTHNNLAIEASNVNYLGLVDKSETHLLFDGDIFQLPFPGFHNAKNFMFALAVANELKLPLKKLKKIKANSFFGRNRCFKIRGITILDESYNASPESVMASLEFLITKPGRHFVVLGSMLELGEHSIQFHRQVVAKAIELGIDGLFIISSEVEADVMFAEGTQLAICSLHYSLDELAIKIKSTLKLGDNLLLKASRKVGLERLIPLL